MSATTAHCCALCSEAIDCDMSLVESYVTACAAHHAVCPKRPIEPPDHVLWAYPARNVWAKGELREVLGRHANGSLSCVNIMVTECSDGFVDVEHRPRPGEAHTFGLPDNEFTIRRIPRPAEAQATVRRGKCCAHPVERHHYSGCADCACCLQWSEHPDRDLDDSDSAQIARMHSTGSPTPPATPTTCAPGCQCDAHEIAAQRPKEGDRIPLEPSAHVLVDGLTRAQCLAAYTCAQNEELPGGAEFLTDAQRAAGQEAWSAALRAKVAAGREADAAREPSVRYCEVDPWD